MDKPNCCWICEHLRPYNPEENKCELDGHIFEDLFILSSARDSDCPLDKINSKGEKTNND